ncbi:MAG TPA: SRPBCC family protein [Candidatus Omnitrophota bacterium]|nr:SRPBCC family protein [Candidatus Omnitrophota bacterium]
MFKIILIGLVIAIAGFAAAAAMQPNEFRVERSLAIDAPAEKIFPYLNDPRKMNDWSPWAKLDPEMKQTYEGSEIGAGAICSWVGNKKVGEGRQTITESIPNELVRTKLEFFKPMQAVNTADFLLKNENGQTVVTWSMYGPNNFIGKAMGLLMNCNKMVGDQFEQGLNSLKAITEKS